MEYITRKELNDLPKAYKIKLKKHIETHKAYWGEDLTEQYKSLGYDVNKDYMILTLENYKTVLKPVKIIEEQKGEK